MSCLAGGRLRRLALFSLRSSSTNNKMSKLVCKDPVPSDIEISQAITPANITEIAAKAGILPEELEPYGRYKAKVRERPGRGLGPREGGGLTQ